MADLRWFAPNRYCALPVDALRRAGLEVNLAGDEPARCVVAADSQCATAAYEYSRRHRCPLLLYLWDLPPWRLEGGQPDIVFDLSGRIRRVPRLFGRYPERAGYYSRLRFVATRAVQVWCPSHSTVEDVRARFGVSAERVPFCYDNHRFDAGSGKRGAGSGGILAISRLVPHKNHSTILRAAARLDPKPRVRIIGQGPEAEPLRELAHRLGVELDLTGIWASEEEIVDAYHRADVVVSTSRFEGFGLTPLEGLAMHLPVIVSDIPPHREFLADAVQYFHPDDDAGLAREMTAALAAPGIPSSRPPVLEHLTIEACARRFLPRFERLLGGRP